MKFHLEKVDIFLENFNIHKEKIRNSDGCRLLELYRSKNDASEFFTYSYWESEDHLEAYRNSALFKKVWAETKILFSDKPMAWSVDKMMGLN
jgi:heme-degrading monooxygenase HmoA